MSHSGGCAGWPPSRQWPEVPDGGAPEPWAPVDSEPSSRSDDGREPSPIPVGIEGLLERCTFPVAGTDVVCAVSGGCDSTALLVLAVASGLQATAVHVDHALREGSAEEAAVVARTAERLGAGFRSVSAPVEPGPGLEARARSARHAALGPDALFGHTADDQAETVLLRLIRGTGPWGMAAMRPDRHPLLRIRRSETRDLCVRLGLETVDDVTNESPVHTRNRIRHEVLPLLDDVARRDVVPLLCRFAEQSSAQADLLEDLSGGIDPTDADALAAAPEPLAVAALRRWWMGETGSLPPDAAAFERMLGVARGAAVGCDVSGRWHLRRSGGRLSLGRG